MKMEMNRKEHWEKVYNTKELSNVGWYQETPITSLNLIKKINPPEDASIIDIGGGAYFLVDNLLAMSYTNISVLDISKSALDKAKKRLGEKANIVNWINEDIVYFIPEDRYMVWHDRAVFHFLTNPNDIKAYVDLVSNKVVKNGHFILGTFSTEGPEKCSGLDIIQYSKESAEKTFGKFFTLNESFKIDHITPSGMKQNFLFCHFIRM